jgi:hypothetical protein
MRFCQTPDEVIDAVGGTNAFAVWFGATYPAVSVWRKRGFPAATFAEMLYRLRTERRLDAPPAAWGQRVPPKVRVHFMRLTGKKS